MSVLAEDLVLTNGVRIPTIGFGTWKIPNDVAPDAVASALATGYRHVDTARVYRNEEGVGQGLKASGIPREEIFVTTKIPSSLKTYDEIGPCVDESLRRLGLDYIDLLLIHGPKPWPPQPGDDQKTYFEENAEVWRAMEEAYDAGKLKAIGVSNFEIPDLQNLLGSSKTAPMVNQIELRVGFAEAELTAFCQANGIIVEAYSPLGTGMLLDNPDVAAVAQRLGVSVPQVCIRYTLQKGAVTLPKSIHPEYTKANTEVDFEIPDADMALLDAIDIPPVD